MAEAIEDAFRYSKLVIAAASYDGGVFPPMEDFLNRISHIKGNRGKGFFYWEPAWIPVPGSGWATEASLKYMNDKGPCGNEWANQALFDYDGNVLPALDVIKNFKK